MEQFDNCTGYCAYLQSEGNDLFTAVLLPDRDGQYPTVITRTPYVDSFENKDDEEVVLDYLHQSYPLLKLGYAMVIQHCRGRGKSSGDCIPYIHEREDGLRLLEWIRTQSFYNGELYLKGKSYLSSVFYAISPFPEDVKGAILSVQDCERYNICYRNGTMKVLLHGNWYVSQYKAKSHLRKHYVYEDSFLTLPLSKFTQAVLGEPAEDFDEMLRHPDRKDPFWNTRYGGADARNAVKHARIPILFTTGFYDIYTGGVFDMWNGLDDETRAMSALVVSPNDHSDNTGPIAFPQGKLTEQFGEDYERQWLEYICGKRTESPFAQGKVTYYQLFENRWLTDDFTPGREHVLTFGNETRSYIYNPYTPPKFKGGLSCNFGGAQFQDPPNSRQDIISVYSEPFPSDTVVRGKMTARLCVQSDCEDTGFYVRLSLTKDDRDFGLRDDITSLCVQHPDYRPNQQVMLDFTFDEHAFVIKRGERIRMDIASADAAHYVRHTNQKGLFSIQETAKIAHNTVHLHNCSVTLPVV